MSAPETDWIEEGKKHFVLSKVRPQPPINYPTQDVHTPKNEADYCLGFQVAKAAWERGEGFSGLESYAAELDEQREAAPDLELPVRRERVG